MQQTWRWFGPEDPVSLDDIRQAGATGVVSALHHIPNGQIWSSEEIVERKNTIEKKGLEWKVVESVPVHEEIKTRSGDCEVWISNYKKTLENLAECGIRIISYNFMPVLDWTRTSLDYETPDGSRALRFEIDALAAFDLHILKRSSAKNSYSMDQRTRARNYFEKLSADGKQKLEANILAGLPGAEEGYALDEFQNVLDTYSNINQEELRKNLVLFLKNVIPTAEACGVLMCLHPDDPPFPILGLPRVVSTEEDYAFLFQQIPSRSNGITFCTGSLGVREDNDLVHIFRRFSDRVHFLHLRSTTRDDEGNFFEANHLEGDVDMAGIIREILKEQKRRAAEGRSDASIPMRPDHGHQMLDDLGKRTNPGYSAVGRLRGLAELRGVELGIYSNTSV